MTKVLLLIKHDLIRLGVISCLADIAIAPTFHHELSWDDLQAQLSENSFDLLIIDSQLSDPATVVTYEKIRSKHAYLKTILLADEGRNPLTMAFLKKGVEGICLNSISPQDLLHACSTVMRGKKFLDHTITDYLLTDLAEKNRISTLSERESQITDFLIQGLQTADIATKMSLAMSTVSTVKFNVYKKMQISNVVELAGKIALFRKSGRIR